MTDRDYVLSLEQELQDKRELLKECLVLSIEERELPIWHDHPRKEANCEGELIWNHRRYRFPGKKIEARNPMEMLEEAKVTDKDTAIPIWMYDHSGLAFSCSHTYPFDCQWDSMLIGFIVFRNNIDRDWCLEEVRNELEWWNEYEHGDTYTVFNLQLNGDDTENDEYEDMDQAKKAQQDLQKVIDLFINGEILWTTVKDYMRTGTLPSQFKNVL
jgi:hypothetical protein